jgi:nucleobase:cation symporter-1, NCS1 family
MQIGLVASALLAAVATTFVGGYVAAASGESNPFVAAAGLTSSDVLLAGLLVAIVVQTVAANLTNVYTAGLSLVNSVPRLGRLRATAIVGAIAVVLSGFPSFIEEAQSWVTHLGNLGAPLTGVVLADYLVARRGRIDVEALYDPDGIYRYQRGVHVAAIVAVAMGIAAYYAVPDEGLKILWGVVVAAAAYLVAREAEARILARGRVGAAVSDRAAQR